MKHGICSLAVIPMRREPSDKAEMTNQVLFGETFSIMDENEKWCMIKLDHDGYEGWVDKKQVTSFTPSKKKPTIIEDRFAVVLDENKNSILIPAGSLLQNCDGKQFHIGEKKFIHAFQGVDFDSKKSFDEFLEQFLFVPYLWGGRTIFGMDCSGFTQIVFRLLGHWIPRDAAQQSEAGELISFIDEARSGDLAFFDNDEGRIMHVGIVHVALDAQHHRSVNIWHCSGCVRVDALDHQGIFNKELDKYTHKLRTIKRIDQSDNLTSPISQSTPPFPAS